MSGAFTSGGNYKVVVGSPLPAVCCGPCLDMGARRREGKRNEQNGAPFSPWESLPKLAQPCTQYVCMGLGVGRKEANGVPGSACREPGHRAVTSEVELMLLR